MGGEPGKPVDQDEASVLAGDMVTLWANLLTLMGQHLREHGTPRGELLALLRMLHDTNEATIQSPRMRAIASQRLNAVYTALETT